MFIGFSVAVPDAKTVIALRIATGKDSNEALEKTPIALVAILKQ